MGLMINPAPTFTLNDGSVASEGKLYFYENGSTTIEKDVFLKPNLDPAFKLNNPLTLTDAGRLPTCFGTGTYTIVLESAAGVQQWVRNDVTIDDLSGQFADYSSVKTYKANEIVRYTDGNYYASQQNNNKGNVPAVNSEWWFQIAFLEFFNTAKASASDYMLNDIVISGGFIYRSLEDNNGDTPPSAKWANLTFNDSVAGNFTVGGDLSVAGGANIGGDLVVDGEITSLSADFATKSSVRVNLDGGFDAGQDIVIERVGNTVTITSSGYVTHPSSSSRLSDEIIPVSYRIGSNYSVGQSIGFSFISNAGYLTAIEVGYTGTIRISYFDFAGSPVNRTDTGKGFSVSYTITSETP